MTRSEIMRHIYVSHNAAPPGQNVMPPQPNIWIDIRYMTMGLHLLEILSVTTEKIKHSKRA